MNFRAKPEQNLRFIPSVTHSYSSYSMASFSNGSSNISMTSYCVALRCYEQATCNAPTDRPSSLLSSSPSPPRPSSSTYLRAKSSIFRVQFITENEMHIALFHFFRVSASRVSDLAAIDRDDDGQTDRQTAPACPAGNMTCEALHLLPRHQSVQCSAATPQKQLGLSAEVRSTFG